MGLKKWEVIELLVDVKHWNILYGKYAFKINNLKFNKHVSLIYEMFKFMLL